MRKIELLSPAGSMEALKAAIHNGADAVYLGGKKFGARAFAQNFNEDELMKTIFYSLICLVILYIYIKDKLKLIGYFINKSFSNKNINYEI